MCATRFDILTNHCINPMTKKIIIGIIAGLGLLIIIGAVAMKKKDTADTGSEPGAGGGIPLPSGSGTGSNGQLPTTGGGNVPVTTTPPIVVNPQPFGACVTPPAGRGRYSSSTVSSDYKSKAKYYWKDGEQFGLTPDQLYNYVMAALIAFDVNVNQNSVKEMRWEIERYLVSSDKKLYYYETQGRLRCA